MVVTMVMLGTQAVLLQCLDALCQYSEQVVAHHKAVTAHLLPALAAAVGRPSESRDSRFLCLKLLCDVILHFLLETDLYIAPQQSQPTVPGWFLSSVWSEVCICEAVGRGCLLVTEAAEVLLQ